MSKASEVIDRLTRPAVEVDKDFVIAAVQCARALRVAMEVIETAARTAPTMEPWMDRMSKQALQDINNIFNGTAGNEGE